MDEVRARRAQQRVAYAADWLNKVQDDLAAGHGREAITHLLTAQAELKILAEQLVVDVGWITETPPLNAPAPVPLAAPGFPRRPALAWAALGVSALALLLFSTTLAPTQHSPAPASTLVDAQGGVPTLVSRGFQLVPPALETERTVPEPTLASLEAELPTAAGSDSAVRIDPVASALPRRTPPRTRPAPAPEPSATHEPTPLIPVASTILTETHPPPAEPRSPLVSPADLILQSMQLAKETLNR